ncbi:MAG: gluconate permease [Planctomycetaceae bacterium]|nr:gluconate permease [Planctomycetaceae bacterium]
MDQYYPLITLAVGVATVIGMIMVLRINAFIALITAAILVSLMAPGEPAAKIDRVAAAFGSTAAKIGIVIGLAAVIGECMMVSGAADRIVQFFIRLLGEKRASWALMLSGFVLSVPVFFDTVFYLLVPLARSLYLRTGKNYLLSLLAIAAGGAITHTLVPPTPGPLSMAAALRFDVGVMIVIGAVVGFPAACIGLFAAPIFDRMLNVPFRDLAGQGAEERGSDAPTPSLLLSLLPVVLPVLMISANTIVDSMLRGSVPVEFLKGKISEIPIEHQNVWTQAAPYTSTIGNANFAMLVSTAIALGLVWCTCHMDRRKMSDIIERSLMSGGVIILITSGGGAFGGMLQEAQIGDAIKSLFTGGTGSGMTWLLLGFLIAALMKFAQGSGTVAMVTTSAMLWAMLGISDDVVDPLAASKAVLGMHPVYLACAIGAGSLFGSWMNDSGFWIFAKMGGLTEGETLRSWTLMLMLLGLASMAVTLIMSILLPLA